MTTNKEFVIAALRSLGKAEAVSLRAKAVSGEADATALIADEDFIPTWTQKDYSTTPVGSPYRYDGQVYQLTQQHDATNNPDWRPGVAYSLWDILHTKDPAKAKPYMAPMGAWGLYDTGDCMIWTDGAVWRSKIENNAYTPDTYAQGWEKVQRS